MELVLLLLLLGIILLVEKLLLLGPGQALLLVLGIVAGALALGIVEAMKSRLTRPHLKLSSDGMKSCTVRTPAHLLGAKLCTETEAYYVRIKVTSRYALGYIARGCRGYLVRLEHQCEKDTKRIELPDRIPLSWAYGQGAASQVTDVAGAVPAFLDVVHTQKGDGRFFFCFAACEPDRYVPLKEHNGEFIFTLAVTADNATPKTRKVKFTWRGDWQDFDVEVD